MQKEKKIKIIIFYLNMYLFKNVVEKIKKKKY